MLGRRKLSELAADAGYDVIVLGAGAAGLSAAIFARLQGCSVLVVERTEYVGGTSALSAGSIWIPNTRHAAEVGQPDSFERASGFLDRAVGNHAPKPLRDAFLRRGPDAIATFERETQVQFRARPHHPDYLADIDGAALGGRAIEPLPFDARGLGGDLKLLRPPIPEFTVLGGMMIDRDDIGSLLRMTRSAKAAVHVARRVARHAADLLTYRRATRLVMGNALIGRMLASARTLGIDILTSTETSDIHADAETVCGVVLASGAERRTIAAKAGVVLASGGFANHPARRRALLPSPVPEFSPSAPGHTGALHDIAIGLGAHFGDGGAQPVFWAPVSTRLRPDGTRAVFPHFVLDRSKPGIIAVDRNGRRFVNESLSYHQFACAQYAHNRDGAAIPCWLVTDARGLKKYGLGLVRPGGGGARGLTRDGYLKSAETLDALAVELGVDPGGLRDTVARINGFATSGVDRDFNRGSNAYQCANGDPAHGPNPTLGAIEAPPFYAIELWPSDIGSATGLVTDENARVLRRDGSPIGGLYACGNDMQSVMGGVYPAPGITLGPAIAFGYIAARHAAMRRTAT